jgi:hypothetical protein
LSKIENAAGPQTKGWVQSLGIFTRNSSSTSGS